MWMRLGSGHRAIGISLQQYLCSDWLAGMEATKKKLSEVLTDDKTLSNGNGMACSTITSYFN